MPTFSNISQCLQNFANNDTKVVSRELNINFLCGHYGDIFVRDLILFSKKPHVHGMYLIVSILKVRNLFL